MFRFRRSPGADRVPVATVPVREGGRLVERDLEGFLRSTGATAFLAVKGDTLVSEVYFHGYRHAATVSSFSGPPNDFWAQGNHGQFVYVSPDRNVVLVRFGTDYNYDHWPDLLAGLARRL